MKHGTKEYYKAEYLKTLEDLDKALGKIISINKYYVQLQKDYRSQKRLLNAERKKVEELTPVKITPLFGNIHTKKETK